MSDDEQVRSALRDIVDYERQIGQLLNKINAYSATIDGQNKHIQELEKMLSECEEKVAALQTTLDEREEELEAVVGDKQAKIISLEASLQFLQVCCDQR